jgi:hypothetical protein
VRRVSLFVACGFLLASVAFSDVSLVERQAHLRAHSNTGKSKGHRIPGGTTGAVQLIDDEGLKFFINTNITFSTSSSASGAASGATYTRAVAATTLNGGTISSTLNQAYDGYEGMCLSLDNLVNEPCEVGNANYVIYNKLGPATTECPGSVSHVNRQVVYPVQTSGSIQMQRKVFIPDNDHFARWLNYFTNTGSSPQTVTMETSNDLSSSSGTTIAATSQGGTTATTQSEWVTTFDEFTGTISPEPRLGHVLQQNTARVVLSGIDFENGNHNPFWGYTFILAPGETKIIMNFGVGEPTKGAAAAQSAYLVALPPNALQCMTQTEQAEIANFNAAVPIAQVPTLSTSSLVVFALLLGGCALTVVRRWNRGEISA